MTRGVRSAAGRLAVAAVACALVSCGELTRQGQSPAYLIVRSVEGAPGDRPEEFAANLLSDVFTAGSIYNDLGRVTFGLGLKDPGPPGSPTTPSPNNAITVTRYRVRYIRADGRNTPGLDVPYPFDGASTVTVQDDASTGFMLVRHQAKLEPPLIALRSNGVIVSMIAEITFYGADQTGREVMATGRIDVSFGNFADVVVDPDAS